MQEAKLDGNNKHYKYLFNLIVIDQQQIHRLIKHDTHTKKYSGIKYIEIPIDSTIPWNNIPSSLPGDKWKSVANLEDIK